MKHFRSVVSLLMVFVLCFGMIPYASAEEAPTPTTAEAPQPTEDRTAKESPPATEAPETTETMETTEAATESTEPATEAPTEETETPVEDTRTNRKMTVIWVQKPTLPHKKALCCSTLQITETIPHG